MLAETVPLLLALALTAAYLAARERRRRRMEIRPRRPDLTLAELGVTDEILLAIEREVNGADTPRFTLRRALLRAALEGLYLEAVLALPEGERAAVLKGYEPGMGGIVENALAAVAMRRDTLRRYGGLKFDDAAREDWFDYFVATARPYVREKLRLKREHVLEMNEGAARWAEIYDELLEELADQALKMHPKQRLAPPDLVS